MNREPFPFWEFSLAVYGRPGVADLCLELQDEWGADVNLLLACLWLGERGRALTAAEMVALVGAVGAWQSEVVTPLRRLRRALKAGVGGMTAPELRKALVEAELDAEYLEQRQIAEFLDGMSTTSAGSDEAVAANLRAYGAVRGHAWDERLAKLCDITRRR